jgi:hypothetical protein
MFPRDRSIFQVAQLSSDLSRTQTMLQIELLPMCSSESRLQTGDLRITSVDTPVRANFLGTEHYYRTSKSIDCAAILFFSLASLSVTITCST